MQVNKANTIYNNYYGGIMQPNNRNYIGGPNRPRARSSGSGGYIGQRRSSPPVRRTSGARKPASRFAAQSYNRSRSSQSDAARSRAAAKARAAKARAAERKRQAELEEKRRLRRKRAVLAFFITFFTLTSAVVCFFYWWNSKLELITYTAADDFDIVTSLSDEIMADEAEYALQMGGTVEENPEAAGNAGGVQSASHITNILLVGTDNTSWKNSRSDSMILVSLNEDTKTIKMCSFIRDTYCDFPSYKGKSYADQKLTHAFAYGGAGLCIATIEHNFGIKIDNYIRVNFKSFPKVINSLGGVKINLTSAESEYLNMQGFETHAGTQRLTGEEALAYSRIRYIDSDFKRTQRQQKVLTSIAAAAKNSSLSEIDDAVTKICDMIQTDLTKSQINSLVTDMLSYLDNLDSMESKTFPEQGTYTGKIIDDMWVAVADIPATAESVQQFIYG